MTSVIEKARPASPERAVVTDADVLERAADLLEEFGWCQRERGRKDAKGFCLVGAVDEASLDLNGRRFANPYGAVDRLLGVRDAWIWNDANGRTKGDVVGILRDASAYLREAQA